MIRKIVQIDEELCDGCGLCIPSCAEGAIRLVNGKARLISESYCDGLGACLGECPCGAISVVERAAEAFDEEAVERAQRFEAHLAAARQSMGVECAGGCPGSAVRVLDTEPAEAPSPAVAPQPAASQLRQWPVQLALLSPRAPYLRDCELLVAADCVPFALGDFHASLLAGKALAVSCPKLDPGESRLDKLAAIFAENDIRRVTVAMMEVPCCEGLLRQVREAVRRAGKPTPIEAIVYTLQGGRKH